MKRNNLNSFLADVTGTLAVFAVLCVFSGTALAEKINLTLQAAPLTILKGGTATKKINGISSNTPGSISLRIKWHVMSLIPNTFNKLKIELMHGSKVLRTEECYSVHSDKDPKCYISKTVDQTEASASGDWKLRVTNSSNHDINGFNIVKEATDLNPFITNIVSTFEPDCSTRYLSIAEADIGPNSSVKRVLPGIPNLAGEVHIRAKWHTDVITPFIFNPLAVAILRDGNVVKAGYGYSIHSDQKNKIDIKFTIAPILNGTSRWELEITNQGGLKINNFGIEKGHDSNPFVPSFKSTFKPGCN